MWGNQHYNEVAHLDQWHCIQRNFPHRRHAVLDLGCGIGRFTRLLACSFTDYVGVDIAEMVLEARRQNADFAHKYIISTIQDYDYPTDSFDFILSMACLANACPVDDFQTVAERIVRSLRPNGRILMIDAFHTAPILTRVCRITAAEVVRRFSNLGTRLVQMSGLHFFPFRILLCRKGFSRFPQLTRSTYKLGETLLKFSFTQLSDYKVIVMAKR